MRKLLLGLGCIWLRTLRVRWQYASDTPPAPALPDGILPARAVILLWHEHLPICMRAFSHRGIHVLISPSRDGAWAAAACRRFGYRVHRGSSSQGSLEGLRALARAMEGAETVGMALDGPRGPRRVPKAGSSWLARRADAAVVPVWAEARFAFRLKSWDRCLVPFPFTKVILRVGTPFHPQSADQIPAAMARVEMGKKAPHPGPALSRETAIARG